MALVLLASARSARAAGEKPFDLAPLQAALDRLRAQASEPRPAQVQDQERRLLELIEFTRQTDKIVHVMPEQGKLFVVLGRAHRAMQSAALGWRLSPPKELGNVAAWHDTSPQSPSRLLTQLRAARAHLDSACEPEPASGELRDFCLSAVLMYQLGQIWGDALEAGFGLIASYDREFIALDKKAMTAVTGPLPRITQEAQAFLDARHGDAAKVMLGLKRVYRLAPPKDWKVFPTYKNETASPR